MLVNASQVVIPTEEFSPSGGICDFAATGNNLPLRADHRSLDYGAKNAPSLGMTVKKGLRHD